jgi:hypothetical protein
MNESLILSTPLQHGKFTSNKIHDAKESVKKLFSNTAKEGSQVYSSPGKVASPSTSGAFMISPVKKSVWQIRRGIYSPTESIRRICHSCVKYF